MSAFISMLERLKARAEQEANSVTSDVIPSPVAGLMGPEELHYNVARNVPLLGGAINLGINGPLHGAGMVQEGLGELAKMVAGYGMQTGAKIDQISGDQLSPERQAVDAAILAQGLAHPGRSLDEARNGPDSGVAYLGGAAEQLANLGNYTNAIGAGGRALSEAPGIIGGIGKGIMGAAAVGEVSNRAMMLPAGFLPRVGKSLSELPDFLKDPNAAKEIVPLIAAVRGSLPDNMQQVANIGDNLDTAARAPLNANIEVPSPSGDVVQGWLARERASGLLPDGTPGEGLPQVDWLRQSLLKNLEAEHGQKYGRLPRNGRVATNVNSQASTLFPESTPQVPDFIKKLEQSSGTGNARGVASFPGNRRIPKGAVVDDPLATFDGMQNEVLKMQDELGRPPTYDEIRYRTGSGPVQSRTLADWVAEQNPGVGAAEVPHPDLDRMDALRGRASVDNFLNLMEANYGTTKNLKDVAGVGSFNAEGRLVAPDGTDNTRGLLNYLLHRGDMSQEERIAYQSALGAKQSAGAIPAGMPDVGVGGSATAVADAPATLRELATDPQFGGSELPGPSYFARKLGISNQEVNAGLEALQQEGVLKPLNKWYGLAPDDAPGIAFSPTRLGVTASGAGIGGLAGLMAADTTDENKQDDWGGAVGGALAGAALGAGLSSPGGARNLKFAGELGRSAIAKQGDAFSTGSKDINWKSISGQWSGQTVENVRNLIQEAMSSVPMLHDKGGSLQVVRQNADSIKDAYIMGARDKASLLPDRAKDVLDRLGLKDQAGNFLVPDMGTEGFQEATGRMQGDLNPIASGIIEGLLPSFTPLGSVPVLGNVVGFAKGFTAPIRKEVYSTLDGITKSSFRSAIWEVASKDAAEQAAQLFASSVLQKTNRVLSLPADGLFSPGEVRQALVNVPSGTRAALVDEWAAYTRAINKTGEDAAKQAFGDFSKFDPATATRGEKIFHGAETGLRKVVPFSSWYIRALPIAAEIASHHPAFTLATLGVLADQARQLKEEGKPGYMVGTVPFDSDTPVIGKAADLLTGGRGGTGRVNVINGVLPFAGQTLGADELGDDATLYQKVESWAGRAGFSFNPIVQGVMYAIGQDWQRPGAMSRTANLEQALPGPDGPSLLQGPLDFVRKQGGNSVSTTTPVERRIAQIVYEQTGLPINAKENAALAAATLDPKHPIVQQAEREIARGNVAKNAASLTLPLSVTASTDLDQQIGKARAESKAAGTDIIAKKTPEQEAQDAVFQKAYPLQYAIAQGRTAAGAAPVDPLTQVYRGADTKGRAYQALAAWEEENAGLKYFAPTYYGSYKQALMQQLGLSPY